MPGTKKALAFVLAVTLLLTLSSCTLQNGAARAADHLQPSASPLKKNNTSFAAEHGENGAVFLTWKGEEDLLYEVTRTDHSSGTTRSIGLVHPGEDFLVTDLQQDADFSVTYTLTAYADASSRAAGTLSCPATEIDLRCGFLLENGYLRFYEDNVPVSDMSVDGLTFDEDGYYTCGDKELDALIAGLITELTTPSMSRLERFNALYHYLTDSGNFTYGAARFITSDITDWENDSAKAFLTSGIGNCFSYSAAVMLFARALGFASNTVIGQCTQLYELIDHCWTEVEVDGSVYLCDAEMEGVYAPNHHVEWDLFLKEYGQTPTGYYFTEGTP